MQTEICTFGSRNSANLDFGKGKAKKKWEGTRKRLAAAEWADAGREMAIKMRDAEERRGRERGVNEEEIREE